ncbi:MAG: stalk domain-containing protein [Firmicutes bacterium]|nr:stalk domain-containing protein [Bacillota bacterium]
MSGKRVKISVLALTVALLLALQVGWASAATIVMQVGQPSMTVDGATQAIDPGQNTVPVIISDRTFVPIRAIVEALGGTVGYAPADQKVTIQLQSTTVELWIGRADATINRQTTTLANIPFVSATNRTMLPLRFVIENLGGQVAWDGINQIITITYGGGKTTQVIAIEGLAFSPATLNVALGDTVTWVNHDSVAHTVIGDSCASPNLDNGQSFSRTFSTSGTFNYHCSIHPFMQGVVIVH